MNTSSIGVVMPTHETRVRNGYTQRAIASVMKQERPVTTLSVYNDVEKRGAAYARQRALMMNDSYWTGFLDSDDHLKMEHFRVLMDAAEETGADYIYTWYDLVQLGTVLSYDPVFPSTHFTEPWDNANPRQTTITVLVKTELAKEVGFWEPEQDKSFRDGHRIGEDYNFTLECMAKGAKIHHVPLRTWYWEHHGRNTSGRPDQGDAL